MLKTRCQIVTGKRQIIITKQASGIDKTKEAVLKVMGPGWEYSKRSTI